MIMKLPGHTNLLKSPLVDLPLKIFFDNIEIKQLMNILPSRNLSCYFKGNSMPCHNKCSYFQFANSKILQLMSYDGHEMLCNVTPLCALDTK